MCPLERVVLGPSDEARLQGFFEANPEYFLAINGAPPRPDEAREEMHAMPPPEWPLGAKWVLGFEDASGDLVAMADILQDLFAPGIWHIGLFIVATALHGRGEGAAIYAQLEAWMRSEGAAYVRLGVVIGNARAERFWERMGYVEVRRRDSVDTGGRVNDLRVMVKPIGGGSLTNYLAYVARDRSDL